MFCQMSDTQEFKTVYFNRFYDKDKTESSLEFLYKCQTRKRKKLFNLNFCTSFRRKKLMAFILKHDGG